MDEVLAEILLRLAEDAVTEDVTYETVTSPASEGRGAAADVRMTDAEGRTHLFRISVVDTKH